MQYYDSAGYTTENGVKFKFQNNYIMAHRFKEPIFVISENTLEEVNFDGLAIDTAEHYREMEAEIADLRRQLEEAKAAEKCAYENVDSALDLLRRDCEKLNGQLENAKISEGYALQTVENLHKEVAELRAEIERLRGLCFSAGLMLRAPCFNCGYNGPGYFQPDKHPCAAFHYAVLRREE